MGDVKNDEPIIGPGSQNQRRTLWIMAAAGIFLLVVIGAAVVLYSPAVNKGKTDDSYASDYNPNDGWNEEGLGQFSESALSDGSTVDEIPDTPFENTLDAANDSSSDVFDLSDMKPFDSAATATAPADPLLADSVFASDAEVANAASNEPTTIDLNKISSTSSVSSSVSAKNDFTAAQIESAKTAAAESSSSYSSKSSSSSASKPSYSSSSSSASSSSSSSSTKSTASSKSSSASSASASSSLSHAYWVQVGSFSDKSKADAARSDLEKKGYRNVSNSTTKENMYRVRIGPYSNKGDAEAVESKVKKYKEYENAFISDANAPLQK